MVLTTDYVLCTFSVGVLQNHDVVFVLEHLSWKVDALSSIDMVCRSSTLDLYLSLIDVPQYHHPHATSVPHHSAGHQRNLLWCTLEVAAVIHAQALRVTVGNRLWFVGDATSLKYYSE